MTSLPTSPATHVSTLMLFAVPAAFLLLGPLPAHAQSCCTATGSGELGVVGRCHKGVAAATLSFNESMGSYDTNGTFRDGKETFEKLTFAVGAGWRLSHRFQLHAAVPIQRQERGLPGLGSGTAQGLGDTTIGARYLAAEDDMAGVGEGGSGVPFVDLFVAARIATGRAPEDSQNETGADIMGTGYHSLSLGTQLTRFLDSGNAIVARVAVDLPMARTVDSGDRSYRVKPGTGLDLRLGWVHVHSLRWSGGVTIGGRITGASSADGLEQIDSQTRRMNIVARLTRAIILPYWEVTASVVVEPWWRAGGVNLPSVGPTGALMLQRNFL